MITARHSRQASPLNRRTIDVSRAAFAISGLALVLAVGLALLGTRPVHVAATPSESDAEARTGTILLANHSDICRLLTFDNTSGRMRDAGWVACGGGIVEAAALVRTERSVNQLNTIRDAFRSR